MTTYHARVDIQESVDADVVNGKLQLLLSDELLLNGLHQQKLGLSLLLGECLSIRKLQNGDGLLLNDHCAVEAADKIRDVVLASWSDRTRSPLESPRCRCSNFLLKSRMQTRC